MGDMRTLGDVEMLGALGTHSGTGMQRHGLALGDLGTRGHGDAGGGMGDTDVGGHEDNRG